MKQLIFLLGILILSINTKAQIVPNVPGNPAVPSTVDYSGPGLADYSSTVSSLRNYTREYIPEQPATTLLSTIVSSQLWRGRITTQYVDGLGRPLQEVARFAVPNANVDIITPHVYDMYGREANKYLPYAKNGGADAGKLDATPYTDLVNFYSALYPYQEPYSNIVYDGSAMNRVIKTMSPGKSWIGNNKGASAWYDVNKNDNTYISNNAVDYNILQYSIAHTSIDDIPTANGYYGEGELYVNKTQDEDGNYKLTFTDKEGKTLASMNYMDELEVANSHYFHITYYVYDDYGKLRFVIPPKAINDYPATSTSYGYISSATSNELCYRYWYNEKGLLTQKKLPGKGKEYLVYDNKNRLVLTQDAKLYADGKWAFTAYDALDRPAFTGVGSVSGYSSQSQWESFFTNASASSYTSSYLGYYLLNYGLYGAIPSGDLTDATIYTKNYYDDYSNAAIAGYGYNNAEVADLAGTTPYAQPVMLGSMTTGMLTGTQVRIINNPGSVGWLTTVNYYDDRGRLIQQQSNGIRGTDRVTNRYDFAGTLIGSVLVHSDVLPTLGGGPQASSYSVKINKKYIKDYTTGAVTQVQQSINGGGFNPIFQNFYDQLGRVSNKKQSAADNKYDYNIKGWLTGINAADIDASSTPSEFFFEQLSYDHGFNDTKLNGNISGITWKNAGSRKHMYGYTYDNINRLKHAEFAELIPAHQDLTMPWIFYPDALGKNDVDYTVSNLKYDYNGNITTMDQRGPDGTSSPSPTDMDKLTYNYGTSSNKLYGVDDAGNAVTSAPDYKDINNTGNDFDYDVNGNLSKDLNKEITSISYSYLNKPTYIDFGSKGHIEYLYDAVGTKLQKTVVDITASQVKTTQYVGPFIYEDGFITSIQHEEGRCRPQNVSQPDGSYLFDYYVKDHLGNTRSTINAEATSLGPLLYNTGLEVSLANTESINWNHLDDSRALKPASATGDIKAALLDASDPNRTIGPAIMLRAMPGDQFAISAESYYDVVGVNGDSYDYQPLVDGLLNTLSGGATFNGGSAMETGDNMQIMQNTIGSQATTDALTAMMNDGTTDPNIPQSFIAYLFYDKNNKLLPSKSGKIQVGTGAGQWTGIGTGNNIQIDEVGYFSVFGFTITAGATYIDNLSVDHYKGNVIEQEEHYYPFGLTLTNAAANAGEKNNFKLTSKEQQIDLGLNWYDFGARMQDEQTGRWLAIDPLVEKHPQISPFVYVANNPTSLIDLDGRDWFNYGGDWHWHDGSSYDHETTDKDGNKTTETLAGAEAVVVFNGSRQERFGTKGGQTGFIDGDGAVTADVTVYGPGGEDDVSHYTGYTMSSNSEKFGAVDEGTFSGNYDEKGKSGSLKSNWAVQNRGPVREMDGGINPNAPSQVDANGDGYKAGIFIHTTNSNGFAGVTRSGAGISTGCLLIAPADWSAFNTQMSGVKDFTIQLQRNRTVSDPIQGKTGPVQAKITKTFIQK